MSNEIISFIVGESILKGLSQEQKDKIISEYIRTQVFGYDFDQIAKLPARNLLAQIVKDKINEELEIRSGEIDDMIKQVIDEQLADKLFIKEWMHKRLLEKAAKKILSS